MGSNHNHPVEVDPQALQDAHHIWNNFTKVTAICVTIAAVVLLLMALFVA
ncbi:MAG TPA: hypothetical protein VFS88_02480 [Micavibrio sp.]|nr:hypothetical protein [Micavibrio sp.]